MSSSRRRFLHAVGASALAAGLPGAKGAIPAQAGKSMDPRKMPRLFVGCCAYSFAKYLAKGRMTMEDFILKGVEMGVHGVDITTYWLKSTEPAYLLSLRHFAYKNGMPFSGAAIGTNM